MTTPPPSTNPSSSRTTTPPAQQSPSAALGFKTETPRWMYYGSWAAAIGGPIVLFTPPRRGGLQSIVLAMGTFAGVNVLVYDHTGSTLVSRWKQRFSSIGSGDPNELPERAKQTKELLRLQRERREAALPEAERRALQEAREKRERGLFKSLWMGGEKDDWKEERAKKDKEAFEQGKGYGDLIVEQVKEVFVGSSKPDEDNSKQGKDDTDDRK